VKTKVCTKCEKRRPVENFNLLSGRNGKPRLHSWCKACTNARRQQTRFYDYATKYGLSVEGLEELNKIFPACAICGVKESATVLHVDHCHTNGTVRGRLCVNCNSGVGQFKDDIKLLHRAAEYVVGDNPKCKRWSSKLARTPHLRVEKSKK